MQFDTFEFVSILQKEIRCGQEREALYWAYQLIPASEKLLWFRLRVCSHENVGIACPTAVLLWPNASACSFTFDHG
jgi:replication-associated recombination protein RarA